MKGRNILTVDDEVDILKLLSFNLKKAGFNVIEAKDGPEAIELALRTPPDLVLLDIMLPNMEGTEVLKALKKEATTADIPVIMLTAKGEEFDRILGLELGAEDYITKPFSPREVILRVKAVLKRRLDTAGGTIADMATGTEVIEFEKLKVDGRSHSVTLSSKSLELTATEYKLLITLLKGRGRVFTRDTLLDTVWGTGCFVSDRTVDTHIRRLRLKLKSYGKYVLTVRGTGYRFANG